MGAGGQGEEPRPRVWFRVRRWDPRTNNGHDPETGVRSRGLRRCLGMGGGAGVRRWDRTGKGQMVPGVRVALPKAFGKRVARNLQLGDLQRRK